jgi:hypothetical protein
MDRHQNATVNQGVVRDGVTVALTMILWLRAIRTLMFAMLGWMHILTGLPSRTNICFKNTPATLHASTYVYGTK